MLRKLFIRTWFGPLPTWTSEWIENTQSLKKYGFDFLLINDYTFFAERCKRTLGIHIAPIEQIAGTRKAGDFDPAYGEIFAEELRGYDFWGHCALDMVFGRLDRFIPDQFLKHCDIFANDPGAICGPFSLYRNRAFINNLFRRVDDWEKLLSSQTMYGFDEIQFNAVVREAAEDNLVRFETRFWQAHDTQAGHTPTPNMRLLADGSLIDGATGHETMMFHFHRYRKWPILAS